MKQQLPALGVWLSRIPSLLLTIVVLVTLSAPAFIQIIGRSTDPSFIFNRPLAGMPAFPDSMSSFDRFRDDLIKFVDDNFGLRAEMVQLNILIHSWFGESGVPSLVAGKAGWMFLKEDTAIQDQFRGLNRFTDEELDLWIDTAEIYQKWLEKQGRAFLMLVAPNQQTIYPEYMPMSVNRVWPETRLDQLLRRLRERQSPLSFVDLRSDLWAQRKLGRLYYKYESHWNSLGAFVAYSASMRKIEKVFPAAKALQMSDFALSADAQRWLIPPKTEIVPVLTRKGKSHVLANEVLGSVRGLNITKATTDLHDAPDVLIYGDSFTRVHFLSYLLETFKSVTYVPNANGLPTDLIKRLNPNLVIYELVERYLLSPLGRKAELETELLLFDAPSFSEVQGSIGSMGGYIDGIQMSYGVAIFFGWARDPVVNAPPTAVYVYYDNRAVGAGKPTFARDDVDVAQGMTDHKMGFAVAIPTGIDLREAGHRLRFFTTNPSGNLYELKVNPPLFPEIEKIVSGTVSK